MAIRIGTAGDDLLFGGDGDDHLFGGAGNDEAHGGDGDDLVDGSLGDDHLFGGRGADTVLGGGGADQLSGAADIGVNVFVGVVLSGGAGGDGLNGSVNSSDVLLGGDGDDSFSVSNDTAFGGAGDDLIGVLFAEGEVTGGAGADRFRVRTAEGNNESTIVTDFTSGEDRLDLSYMALTAGALLDGAALFARLDADRDGRLTAGDTVAEGEDGVFAGIKRAGSGIVVVLGEDTVTLEGAGFVAAADWL